MKNKVVLAFLVVLAFTGCKYPSYLPSSDKIDINTRGSYITVFRNSAHRISGELISIDDSNLILLSQKVYKSSNPANLSGENLVINQMGKTLISIPLGNITRCKLLYAQPKHYEYAIGGFALLSLLHGWYFLISAPLNVLISGSVAVSAKESSGYDRKFIDIANLRMFARFPQGIPPNIDRASIQ
jgi:hypothetical protein